MHRTIQNTSRLTKVVRTVGITVGIVAGSASAASAVNGGSFVPSFLSEPTTTAAPLVATTTPKITKALEPTPTTAKALEPTPTTTKAPEPTPTTKASAPTTKAPEPTTAKALEPTTTPTTKAPEPTNTTKAPEVHTPESLQLSCERKRRFETSCWSMLNMTRRTNCCWPRCVAPSHVCRSAIAR